MTVAGTGNAWYTVLCGGGRQPNTEVVQVDWQSIAGGDKEMQDLLKRLGM